MRQLCIDCEGPITKNDNALELCQHFLPRGGEFFSLISRYDDFLADIVRKKGYRAGNTLSFILPFLRAASLSNKKVIDFSRQSLLLISGAEKILPRLAKKIPIFIISTSYQPYVQALCQRIKFPFRNTYSTYLDLDKYHLSPDEVRKLNQFLDEVSQLPAIEISGVKKKENLSASSRKTIKRLDEIFFYEIPRMSCGRMLEEVKPLGGEEKAKAILDSIRKTGSTLSEVMYIGDSITDVEALELVRKAGGVAISFNGNHYALRAARIACISPHFLPLKILVEMFYKEGKGGLEKTLRQEFQNIEGKVREEIFSFEPPPQLGIINENNLEALIPKSESMRKRLRGEKIGGLG
jgi:energy-converting hydrogenase A subunit R